MKVFYLAQVNFGCVVYADNKNDAFEKIKCQRKESNHIRKRRAIHTGKKRSDRRCRYLQRMEP